MHNHVLFRDVIWHCLNEFGFTIFLLSFSFLIDISILSCFLQWANLLDFILGMSYGDMCCLLELGIMTEGVGCVCFSNYSIHRTEHSSTSCKCLSCAPILEHKKKKPVQLFWNLRCLVHKKVKSHKLWCFFNAAFVQKPNSIVFRLVTRIISLS
jgi:hypothetical protein